MLRAAIVKTSFICPLYKKMSIKKRGLTLLVAITLSVLLMFYSLYRGIEKDFVSFILFPLGSIIYLCGFSYWVFGTNPGPIKKMFGGVLTMLLSIILMTFISGPLFLLRDVLAMLLIGMLVFIIGAAQMLWDI